MPERAADYVTGLPPSPECPLQGLTVLAVEDSRFACDALRLLCLRSGARIRRADCVASARRHLRLYRPDVVLVDLGLPDGRGEDLIAELAAARPPIGPVIAISGDPAARASALAAGAAGFLDKPIHSLNTFQNAVLAVLPVPVAFLPAGECQHVVAPDPLALHDDLAAAAKLLSAEPDKTTRRYLAGFLAGLARSSDDEVLLRAARGLGSPDGAHGDIARLVAARLLPQGEQMIPTRNPE